MIQNIPNCQKIKQVATKYTKWSRKMSKFSITRLSKIYQNWGFGPKIYRLATLCPRRHPFLWRAAPFLPKKIVRQWGRFYKSNRPPPALYTCNYAQIVERSLPPCIRCKTECKRWNELCSCSDSQTFQRGPGRQYMTSNLALHK
jgi:hypothetical protein